MLRMNSIYISLFEIVVLICLNIIDPKLIHTSRFYLTFLAVTSCAGHGCLQSVFHKDTREKLHVKNILLSQLIYTIMIYIIMILLGRKVDEFVDCILLSIALGGPLGASLIQIWADFYFKKTNSYRIHIDIIQVCGPSFLRIFFAWAASLFVMLDWQTPWVIWPIPNILGTVFGYFIGGIMSSFVPVFYNEKPQSLQS